MATLDRGTWQPAPVFDLVRQVGAVSQPDLEATLNCGVGMVSLTHPDAADAALELLGELGIDAWVAGQVDVDPHQKGTVELVGQHPGW